MESHKSDVVALNADVVGYTALMADDLEATTSKLAEYHQLVDATVADNGGTLINFVGDNFMAIFDEATSAMRAAIAVTTEVEARNADDPASRWMRFRMGLAKGQVTVAEGDHLGEVLNIAARIQAIAPPGGIAVSGWVYQALDEPALRFRSMGLQRLKNIPEQIDVYEFVGLPTDRSVTPVHGSLDLETPVVAVLPVQTEMVDDAVQSAAGMIRRELLHRLAGMPQLDVVDAKAEPGDEQSGASARYMLESGVHQVGDNIRFYTTLFDVTTMNVVKSHKWSAKVDEVFDLSDTIADEVARTVAIELVVGAPAGTYAELRDADAIENVYRGWYHLRTNTKEGWDHALELFGAVAESHPDQPFGHVLTAFALWAGVANGWATDPEETLCDAFELAAQGLEVGDPTGMAQAVQAAVLMSQGKVDEALERLEGLETIRPTCDVTYGLEGSVRRYMGQWQKAAELLDTAMRLTGVNKPWYPTVKACSLFMGGRNEEAVYLAENVLEYQPNNLEALLVLAGAQVELGMERRARATGETIKERFPSFDVGEWLEQNPYQNHDLIDRWKADLASSGAIDG